MNAQFLYEDGHGNVREQDKPATATDEQLSLEPAYNETEELESNESVTEQPEMSDGKGTKRQTRSVYSDKEKESFFKLKLEKCLSASAAAKQLGINARTAQRWSQDYDKDPDGVFGNKKRRSERKSPLSERHRQFLQTFIDDHPSAVLDEVMEQLSVDFGEPKISKSSVYNFLTTDCSLSIKYASPTFDRDTHEAIQQNYEWAVHLKQSFADFLTNCVFLDESAFYINMRRSMAWSRKGGPNVSTTRAKTTTILGAISATRLIKISLGMPQLSKESMIDYQSPESNKSGVVAGHYLNFVKATLDEMDTCPEMKGYYLVMDNASVQNPKEIGDYINSRGYQFIYLPPYSHDFNPMKLFWNVVKCKVKRTRFSGSDTITTRIKESCDSLSVEDFQTFARHSDMRINEIVAKGL